MLHTTNWRLAKSGAKYLAFAGKLVGGGEGEEEMENEDVIGVAEVCLFPRQSYVPLKLTL